jgi:hypothetical protein
LLLKKIFPAFFIAQIWYAPNWRPSVKRQEQWDSSDEKAKELALSMFGSPEEVREKARMPIEAKSYNHVRCIIMETVGKPLKSKSGLIATIT